MVAAFAVGARALEKSRVLTSVETHPVLNDESALPSGNDNRPENRTTMQSRRLFQIGPPAVKEPLAAHRHHQQGSAVEGVALELRKASAAHCPVRRRVIGMK
jgi:hypothetical protein